ncbi:hypothetical protein MMC16_001891 [Acarospora aff. strigata]|nr:hypothetical protein [Acarospora aff. strigata]
MFRFLLTPAILCLPCIIIFCPPRCTNPKRDHKARLKNAPKPLPLKHRRELSTAPKPRLQADSPLLRLPAEIRLKIYYEVFGGEVLHLIQLPKRLAHVRCCSTLSATDVLRRCIPGYRWPAVIMEMTKIKTSSLDLALLQSCRQIYTEAIDIMYATNLFDIDDPSTLLYLSQTIRPQRFAAIKYLQFSWAFMWPPFAMPETKDPTWFPHDDATWETFWRLIETQMPGLLELTFVVQAQYPKQDWSLDEGWVQPLLRVRGLKEFRLELSYASNTAVVSNVLLEPFRQRLTEIMCAAA